MQLDQELSRRDMCVGIILSAIHLAGIARAPENIQAGTSYRLMPLGFTVDSLTVHAPPLDDMAEALLLIPMQEHRTSSQIAQITAESINPIPLFWRCAGLDESLHAVQAKRINEAVQDTESIVIELKRRYNRPRPSVVLPALHPVVPIPAYSSYPSGHATQSIVIAALMSEIAPKSENRLTALAVQVGCNREIAGLHYPSDTRAGFKLGRELTKIFLRT